MAHVVVEDPYLDDGDLQRPLLAAPWPADETGGGGGADAEQRIDGEESVVLRPDRCSAAGGVSNLVTTAIGGVLQPH